MASLPKHPSPTTAGGEPGDETINGWEISWNPDDDKFYVCHLNSPIPAATFKDRRNARRYARTHDNR